MPANSETPGSSNNANFNGPDTGVMDQAAFEQARSEFLARVLIGGANPLGGDQQSFLHAELKALVSVLPGTQRLVIVHLGVQAGRMRYGFSFRAGTKVQSGLEYTEVSDPTHILEDSDFLPISAAEWKPFHDAYRTNVHLKFGEGAPVPVGPADAHAVVVHWDLEIDRMYKETTKGIKDDHRIMLSSVSVQHSDADGGTEGFRHGVSFHCERKVFLQGWTPLLDNVHHSEEIFHYKASDFGNLCPPRCRKYVRG